LDECFFGYEEGSWSRQGFWMGSWNVKVFWLEVVLIVDWVELMTIVCYLLWKYRYAYAVSSALHGVSNILHKDFMIQVILYTHFGILWNLYIVFMRVAVMNGGKSVSSMPIFMS
jgi:hypothetical protein